MYGCHVSRNIKSIGSVVMVVLRDHNLFSGNRDFEHTNSVDLKGPCRAIAHVISCQPMTAEAQIKSQGSHSTITNLTCDLYCSGGRRGRKKKLNISFRIGSYIQRRWKL